MGYSPVPRRTADTEGGLKGAARQRRSLQGVGGGQPPTSTRRVYTGALLAATTPQPPSAVFVPPITMKNQSIAMASSSLSMMSFTTRNLLGGRRDSLESNP